MQRTRPCCQGSQKQSKYRFDCTLIFFSEASGIPVRRKVGLCSGTLPTCWIKREWRIRGPLSRGLWQKSPLPLFCEWIGSLQCTEFLLSRGGRFWIQPNISVCEQSKCEATVTSKLLAPPVINCLHKSPCAAQNAIHILPEIILCTGKAQDNSVYGSYGQYVCFPIKVYCWKNRKKHIPVILVSLHPALCRYISRVRLDLTQSWEKSFFFNYISHHPQLHSGSCSKKNYLY